MAFDYSTHTLESEPMLDYTELVFQHLKKSPDLAIWTDDDVIHVRNTGAYTHTINHVAHELCQDESVFQYMLMSKPIMYHKAVPYVNSTIIVYIADGMNQAVKVTYLWLRGLIKATDGIPKLHIRYYDRSLFAPDCKREVASEFFDKLFALGITEEDLKNSGPGSVILNSVHVLQNLWKIYHLISGSENDPSNPLNML